MPNALQAHPAAEAATSPSDHRLLTVRLDRVRSEMEELGIDESTLARWGMSPGLVHAVLTTGRASRATLRRLKRSLRTSWSVKVNAPADVKHHSRITMKYLSDEIAAAESPALAEAVN